MASMTERERYLLQRMAEDKMSLEAELMDARFESRQLRQHLEEVLSQNQRLTEQLADHGDSAPDDSES